MKTNDLEMMTCKGRKVPKFLSTKPTAFSALVRHWRTAIGPQSCLLTMQLFLLTTGVRRAKRKESFRLKEERRDADGEGDPPCWLHLLLGWGVGGQKTLEHADHTRTEWKAPQTHSAENNVTGVDDSRRGCRGGQRNILTFSSLFLNMAEF